MSQSTALADHLAPDSVSRLERAAALRMREAEFLIINKQRLIAIYLLGYVIEMYLSAAYFRSLGFAPTAPIDRETRKRRMAQARQLQGADGRQLMSGDPHPLVGWARYLEWQRVLSGGLTDGQRRMLREAIRRSEIAYRHWRPELRYKMSEVRGAQLREVQQSAEWFILNYRYL